MNQKSKKWIKMICVVLVLIIIIAPISNVFGALNTENMENATANGIADVIQKLLNVGLGALGAPLISLGFMLLMVVFIVLYFLFSPVSGSGAFPFADQIVFNKLAFFDPNFFNPPKYNGGGEILYAPVVLMKSIIQNTYYSLFIIAGVIFVIAAMIIGIKLAVSTIASDKAHFKKALNNWILGIVLLFILPFLMAGVFAINETIVQKAYDMIKATNITFRISLSDIVNAITGVSTGGTGLMISKAVGSVVDWVTKGLTGATIGVDVPGYGGLILSYMIKAAGGDLVGLIVSGILIGQAAALIFVYVKRLFYCIVLAIIAPLVVAVDIIKQGV